MSFSTSPGNVDLIQTMTVEGRVFAVFEISGKDDRGFGYAEIHGGTLQMRGWQTKLWQKLPTAGSWKAPVVPLAPDRVDWTVAGGYVDPTLTRLESVAPNGEVIDEAQPIEGTILLAVPVGAQMRVIGGDELVAATFTVSQLFPADTPPFDDSAENTAKDFLEAVQMRDWDRASEMLRMGLDPKVFLPPIEDLVDGFAFGSVGPSDFGVVVQVTTPNGNGILILHLAKEASGWKVWNYNFTLSP